MKKTLLSLLIFSLTVPSIFMSCKSSSKNDEDENTEVISQGTKQNTDADYSSLLSSTKEQLINLRDNADNFSAYDLYSQYNDIAEDYRDACRRIKSNIRDNKEMEKFNAVYVSLESMPEYINLQRLINNRTRQTINDIKNIFWINASTKNPRTIFSVKDNSQRNNVGEEYVIDFLNYENVFTLTIFNDVVSSGSTVLFFTLNGENLVVENLNGQSVKYVKATDKDWLVGKWEYESSFFNIESDGKNGNSWKIGDDSYTLKDNMLTRVHTYDDEEEELEQYYNEYYERFDYRTVTKKVKKTNEVTYECDFNNDKLVPITYDNYTGSYSAGYNTYKRSLLQGPGSVNQLFSAN